MTKATKKTETKQYQDIGFWENRNGNGYSTKATPEAVERLKRIINLIEQNEGGVLTFRSIPEEFQREKGPTFRLDYWLPKEEQTTAPVDSL